MDQIHGADGVLDTLQRMVHCAQIIGVPLIANTQYQKGLGSYAPGLEKALQGVPRSDKMEFNAVANPETRALIRALPPTVNTAILVGVETHICIYQTAMGLLGCGLTPWIVADGVSARSLENHQLGLSRLRDIGAVVGPAEMILYELLGKAGTSTFKAVLPYIR